MRRAKDGTQAFGNQILASRPRIAAAAFTCRYNSSSISIVAFMQTS